MTDNASQKRLIEMRKQRRAEESCLIDQAKRENRNVTAISESDGCELTVTPDGDVFYNMGDWY